MNDMFSASHIHKFARQLIYTRRHNLKPGKWNILKIKFEYFSQWCGSWSAFYESSLTSKSVSCHSFLAILDCKCFMYTFLNQIYLLFSSIYQIFIHFHPLGCTHACLRSGFLGPGNDYRLRIRVTGFTVHYSIY